MLQSMAMVQKDSCEILSPFRPIYTRIAISEGGELLGKGGRLQLEVDSLRRRSGATLPVHAVLDSLEWSERLSLSDSGTIARERRSIRHDAAVPAAVAGGFVVATGGIGIIPVSIAGLAETVRRGSNVVVEAGELAALRLTRALVVPRVGACHQVDSAEMRAADQTLATLPHFSARTTNQAGTPGDQVNFVFLGTELAIDSAFAHADWVPAPRTTHENMVRGATAAVLNEPSAHVTFSNAWYQGRVEDLAFERPGPTARERHHIRLWYVDSTRTVWVGADEDIGLKIDPGKLEATHRVAPDIDDERDILTRDLEAGGCAALLGYIQPSGAVTAGVNAWGQAIQSDGRVAVVQTTCRTALGSTR
jgi:hypothetical protein